MPDFLRTLEKGFGNAIEAPINAIQGNFSGALGNVEDAFAQSIHSVDQIPVVGPYIGPAVASIFGGPLGGAAAQGVERGVEAKYNGASTGNAILGGAEGAGLSYLGGQAGAAVGTYAGNALGGTDLGNFLNNTPAVNAGNAFGGTTIGDIAPLGSTLGNALGSSTTGSAIGSALGSNIGADAASFTPPTPGPTPFSPSQQAQAGIPQSLSQFSNLTPQQQASNIATKGVYGGGQGPDEQNYFLNLINRQLFDQTGKVATDTSSISPIENAYLNQLGISGSTPNDVLQGISKYGT